VKTVSVQVKCGAVDARRLEERTRASGVGSWLSCDFSETRLEGARGCYHAYGNRSDRSDSFAKSPKEQKTVRRGESDYGWVKARAFVQECDPP